MSTENEPQTEAPRTAAALIQEAARVVAWTPDTKHPLQARYDAARAMASMYAYWTVVSLETLRRTNPALAEAVTTHIDNDLDWADAHEHAYGWEQTLAAGQQIPADAWPFPEILGQPAGEHHTGTLNLAGQGNPTPSPTSDEAVEVATRMLHPGLFESDGLLHPALVMSGQVQARQKVRAALEAAYPAIRQQVAEQIAGKADEIAEEHQRKAIEHRDLSDRVTPKGQRHWRTSCAFRDKADGAWEVAHAAREIGGQA